MPEITRLSGSIDRTDLDLIEREATPRFLMKLGIQLHLAGLSLSNIVSIFDIFDVDRARSTVHIRFTRRNYSRNLVSRRLTLRLMRL